MLKNYYDKQNLSYKDFKKLLISKFVYPNKAVIACNNCEVKCMCSLDCVLHEEWVEGAWKIYSTPCKCGSHDYRIQTGW